MSRVYYPLVQGSDEWHQLRNLMPNIKASEAAALIGLNPFKSTKQAITELSLAIQGTPVENKIDPFLQFHIDRGHALEPVALLRIRCLFLKLHKCGTFINGRDLVPFSASPDGLAECINGGRMLIEVKAPQNRDQEVKSYYIVQLMVQMYCSGVAKGILVYVWSDGSVRIWDIEWDQMVWDEMLEWFRGAWELAQQKNPIINRSPNGEKRRREQLLLSLAVENKQAVATINQAELNRRKYVAGPKMIVHPFQCP
jgi:putative phage-type endonuclease